MANDELIIVLAGIGIGLVVLLTIPIIIFLIVKKILTDRHKERLAMIERGFIMSQSRPQERGDIPNIMDNPQSSMTQMPYTATPSPRPRAEDSTIKWMYIIGGIAVGLVISSIVVDWINYYTVMDTGGIGFSIVVLCACTGLYIYHRRRAAKVKREEKTYYDSSDEAAEERKQSKDTYTED